MSYMFNGGVLGGGHQGIDPALVPAGKLSKIRHPAEVFLFGDGKRGGAAEFAYEVFCSGDATLNGTLFDYWGRGGYAGPNWPTFDYARHRKRMNVAFVDGHVETLDLPNTLNLDQTKSDLDRAGVSKGIYQ
jgi:prepilin-type processing-associated H-X9-DG protein